MKHLFSYNQTILMACVVLLAGMAASADDSSVAIRKAALYSSGVGYFEHVGEVTGSAETRLQFKTEQVNDILKSLVLEDLDGGRIGAVIYPSRDPIAKTLQGFQINLGDNPNLEDILRQLRGAAIHVVAGAPQFDGIILGVEKRLKALSNDSPPVEVPFINILTGAAMRSISLDEVSQIELKDPLLQAELNKALETLAQSRDQNKKPITLTFNGEGKRRVRFGYLVETPIWKTSYRLILDEKSEKGATLQGWAIVENQTDNDWNKISLSLVSGRPMSFVQDLYQPLYIQRPVVQPELFSNLVPEKYSAGYGIAGRKSFGAGGMMGMGMMGGAAKAESLGRPQRGLEEAVPPPAAMAPEPVAADAMESSAEGANNFFFSQINPAASVASAAAAGKVGELFQYTVGEVTLPRQSSAMLPIVTDPISVERVSIYNRQTLESNPLLGARMTNTTGKHLLQGPITVFDEGAYAGDSQIDNLPPSQNRLLSYAIDLKVRINSGASREESGIFAVRIVKGVLELSNKRVSSQDYVITNQDTKVKTILIEHPIRGGWKIVDTPNPVEKTDTLYRFSAAVPAETTQTFTVKEEIIDNQSIAILPMDPGQIEVYSRHGQFPETVRNEFAKVMEARREMAETERQIAERNTRIGVISTEQERIRANMNTGVDQKSQYYIRLIDKLNEQETLIEGIQKEVVELQARLEIQRKQLEDRLLELNIQ